MINQKRLVSTFLDLVKIDSPTGDEKNIANYVAERLKYLGGKVIFDNYGNIIAKFTGTGEPFLLNSHLDTVEPGKNIKPKIVGDKIISDGTTILGADDKSGVAIIIETLTSLFEDKISHLPVEAVFTLEEETGLIGATNLDYSNISAKTGVTFDGVGSVNNLTSSAPGYRRVDVAIKGRGAHAGVEPEKGISAIKIASEIIHHLQVGRIDEETTANIGMIEGGSARNAIPENVRFKAEIRSRSLEKLEKHTQHFEETINNVLLKYEDAKADINIYSEFDPYLFEESHAVIQQAVKTLKNIGLDAVLAPSGGGSDVSIFHAHGIEAICVGAAYYNPHTTREYVIISELVQAATFCEQLIRVD